jgi:hypothetical protein
MSEEDEESSTQGEEDDERQFDAKTPRGHRHEDRERRRCAIYSIIMTIAEWTP